MARVHMPFVVLVDGPGLVFVVFESAALSERVYHCGKCGLVIDRDVNAAIDIQIAGSAPETLNARGGSVGQIRLECGTMRHPAKREPSGGDSRVRLGAGLGNEAM